MAEDAVESAGAKAPAITISIQQFIAGLEVLCHQTIDVPRFIPNSESCLYRKLHPALIYLQLEGSSAILLVRPAHPFFDGLLHFYGPRLRSLFAHPEPDRLPNSPRCRESRPASATGRLQPENSSTASTRRATPMRGSSLKIPATCSKRSQRSITRARRRRAPTSTRSP
jgi:hypothetical protein